MELANAPLVEVITELRWGQVARMQDGKVSFRFNEEDTLFFVGRFHSVAKESGFSTVERTNLGLQGAPHVVTHRFRKAPNVWPCYQIGIGAMTTNQLNDGYKWENYKKAVLSGLEMLDKAHPSGTANIPRIGVDLKYQDGFIFGENETPDRFLKEKLNFGFSVPEQFLTKAELKSPVVTGNNIGFEISLQKPAGVLAVLLNQASINKKPGFVMETSVRSTGDLCPEFSRDAMNNWLEEAHHIQRLAFQSFINPAYMKSFK